MNLKDIKKLREQTGAGVVVVKNALEEAKGDLKKAKEILKKKGLAKAKKKSDRATQEGRIHAYIHAQGRVGALVEVNCETDFVARNPEFESLCQEVGMQVASMNPKDVDELMSQDYIRDPKKTIKQLITEAVAKLGENISVGRFTRYELGQE